MTTSQYGGQVRWDTTRLAALTALDAGLVNDGLLNNVAHLVDEQSQVLIDTISPTSAQYESWSAPSTVAGTPSPVIAHDVVLHALPNGQPRRLVVECMGAYGGNTGTVSFLVAVRARDERGWDASVVPPRSPGAGLDLVTFSFASTTPAWATPQTIDFSSLRTIDSMRVTFGGAGTIYARATSGGSPASVDLIQARIEVWAYATSTSTVPKLYGLMVREFCGPGT